MVTKHIPKLKYVPVGDREPSICRSTGRVSKKTVTKVSILLHADWIKFMDDAVARDKLKGLSSTRSSIIKHYLARGLGVTLAELDGDTKHHRCHAESCHEFVAPHLFMCVKHWAMLPWKIQGRLWKAFKPDDTSPPAGDLALQREAVELVATLEGLR